jgi:hypothetical protein
VLRDSDPDAAKLVERRHLVRGWNPEADPAYANLIDRVFAGHQESK